MSVRKLVFKRETRKPTPSEHRLIVRLIKSGRSYGEIARVLGCSRGSLRDYCGKRFTELPFRCRYCGKRFCLDHHIPEVHKCKGLPGPSWGVYRGERVKREPVEPIREPAWIPAPEYPARRWKRPPSIKHPIRRWKKPSKTRDILESVALGVSIIVLAGVIIWALYVAGPVIWEKIQEISPQSPTLPSGYYGAASNYVATNYNLTGEKNITNLVAFLDQVQLRDYVGDVFDCSETSAMLEWLLEGAGFNASIALTSSAFWGHSWVLVTLNNGDTVVIESTSLTQNYYAPPGIIEAPGGRFREYTYEYRMQMQGYSIIPSPFPSLGIPTRETYYNPPKTYASLEDAVKPQYYGGTPISEFDWWNASPYNNMAPFNGWD